MTALATADAEVKRLTRSLTLAENEIKTMSDREGRIASTEANKHSVLMGKIRALDEDLIRERGTVGTCHGVFSANGCLVFRFLMIYFLYLMALNTFGVQSLKLVMKTLYITVQRMV